MNCKLSRILYGGLVLVLAYIALQSCQRDEYNSKGSTIDIRTAPKDPTIFGKNHISTPLYERDIAISPSGDEIIFTRADYKQLKRCLLIAEKHNDRWGEPKILNFSGYHHDIEPFYSYNGNRLYFASNRPIFNDPNRNDYNIWYSDKIEGIWSEPRPLDSIINTENDEFFPSVSKNGNMYFTATRENGIGKEDIFMAKFEDGKFQSPEPLASEINSGLFEFNAFISPDEEYIIFGSFGRQDGFGGGDLYISRKDKAGRWETARNLGGVINSDQLDFCPFVDWKSRNFYFSSERITTDTGRIENVWELKHMANRIENGFGNIYKIAFEELKIEEK